MVCVIFTIVKLKLVATLYILIYITDLINCESDELFRCHDVEYCVCSVKNNSLKCSNMDKLSSDVFDNSLSNITETFSIDEQGTRKETQLSWERFTKTAPYGYRVVQIKNACISLIQPGFFTYMMLSSPPNTTVIKVNQKLINVKLNRISITNSLCLTELLPRTFYQLPYLSTINLSANSLNKIHPRAFQRLPQLNKLFLSHNRLHQITNDTFYQLSSLDFLDLSFNDLVSIAADAFQTLPNLQYLDLNKNKLQVIAPQTFSDLWIMELNLTMNNLEKFTPNIVSGTTKESLRSLDLRYNKLTTISEGVMDFQNSNIDHTIIYLDGNDWNCNCDLAWIKKRVSNIDQNSVICSHPKILAKRPISSISNLTLCPMVKDKPSSSSTSPDKKPDMSEYIGILVCIPIVILAVCTIFVLYRSRDRLVCHHRTPLLSNKNSDKHTSPSKNTEEIPFTESLLENDGVDGSSSGNQRNHHNNFQNVGV